MLGMLQPTPSLSFPSTYSNNAPPETTNATVFHLSAIRLRLRPNSTIPEILKAAHKFFLENAQTIQKAIHDNKDHLPNGTMEQFQLRPICDEEFSQLICTTDDIGENLKESLDSQQRLLVTHPDLGQAILLHAQPIIQAMQVLADSLTR